MTDNLVIFDVDGTLIDSLGVDDGLFARACSDALGIDDIDTDWSAYRHVTDLGIITELYRQHFERGPSDHEVAQVQRRHIALLEAVIGRDSTPMRAIPGAAEALGDLGRQGWTVAIATGGGRDSALLKLGAAGLDISKVPAAFSEDGPARESIMETARTRAFGEAPPAKTVYVGDGVWDTRAAARLGLGFVGVAFGTSGDRLREAGASHILHDYTDFDRVLRYLDLGTVTQRSDC